MTQLENIGRYQIVKELGRGAMGVVFQAVDPTIGRTVAIKTIRLGDVSNPQERIKLRERLFREARSAGILSHPNIVTIYDMQEEGDLTYIAMEFVDGSTLDALMSGAEPLAREEVLRILHETASGLDYAHQKGIVHRDIKPANIMLDAGRQVKITDFGIAKVSSSEQFTMTGTIVGTPNYMSPEQVQGLPTVDGLADQFSLAVIAFELLTGEKPFTGEHLTTVVYKIVSGEPIAPRRLNPSLGPEIEKVLRKGLAKAPDARYLSCLEFVNALTQACAGTKGWTNLARGASQEIPTLVDQPVSTKPLVGRTPPVLPPPRARARMDDTSGGGKGRHRVSAVTIVLAVLVAAGLVGLIAWQAAPWLIDSGKQETASTPAPPTPVPERPANTPTPQPEVTPPEPAAPQAESAPRSESKRPEELPVPSKPVETPKPAETPKGVEPQPKPSPERAAPAPAKPVARRGAQEPVPPQAVGIVTNPVGALAAIDGGSAISCHTPCTITIPPGRHSVVVTMPGYQTEHRQIDVTDGPQDLPPITLRRETGTIMLTSNPQGATVTVDGKPQDKVTPMQLTLPPGTYTIATSKDGLTVSKTVQVRNGSIQILRMELKTE